MKLPRRLINAEEAGAMLSVPPSWLMREARENRVPHVRLGKYIRFDPNELESWWRARMRGPTTDVEEPPSPNDTQERPT